VSVNLVALALLMAAVTYPSRALPMLVPGIERLPARAAEYLRLVGPSVLGALAAVNVMIVVDAAGHSDFHVGIEWPAVLLCVAIVVWRGVLLGGLVAAVVLVAVARATGLA